MADALTAIDYEATLTKAKKIETAANNIAAKLDEVRAKMKEVNTSDVWESDAAGETYAKFEQLAKNFEGAHASMIAYKRHLEDAVEIHKEVDRVMKQKADELLSTNV